MAIVSVTQGIAHNRFEVRDGFPSLLVKIGNTLQIEELSLQLGDCLSARGWLKPWLGVTHLSSKCLLDVSMTPAFLCLAPVSNARHQGSQESENSTPP